MVDVSSSSRAGESSEEDKIQKSLLSFSFGGQMPAVRVPFPDSCASSARFPELGFDPP